MKNIDCARMPSPSWMRWDSAGLPCLVMLVGTISGLSLALYNYYQVVVSPGIPPILLARPGIQSNVECQDESSTRCTNNPYTAIDQLKQYQALLSWCLRHHPIFSITAFAFVYLLKQTFAIPGSMLLNIAAGSVFPFWFAFPFICTLTTIGASGCYLLSWYVLSSPRNIQWVVHFFHAHTKYERLLTAIQEAQKQKTLLYYLIGIRVFPVTPNWLINLLSPSANVPLHIFSLAIAIGLMPYNYITVQAGVMLASIASTNEIWSPWTLLGLLGLSGAALLPVLFKKSFQTATTKQGSKKS